MPPALRKADWLVRVLFLLSKEFFFEAPPASSSSSPAEEEEEEEEDAFFEEDRTNTKGLRPRRYVLLCSTVPGEDCPRPAEL